VRLARVAAVGRATGKEKLNSHHASWFTSSAVLLASLSACGGEDGKVCAEGTCLLGWRVCMACFVFSV
jgi:hypothetical protein